MNLRWALPLAAATLLTALMIAWGMQQRERNAQLRHVCEAIDGGCARRRSDDGTSCEECSDLLEASTWQPLNGSARANLFVAAARVGLLGDGLRACAALMDIGTFEGGLRGAMASRDLQPSESCMVSVDDFISIETVKVLLGPEFVERVPDAGNEEEEDVWLSLLLHREKRRPRSALAPYIHSSFSLPSSVPAGWNPETKKGSKRRASLPSLELADGMRDKVDDLYSSLVEPAIEQLPHILAEGLEGTVGIVGEEGGDKGAAEKLAKLYSFQPYLETYLALRTRVFGDAKQSRIAGLQGTSFLVPLLDMLNHGGNRSSATIAFDVKRRGFVLRPARAVSRGEQITWNYVTHCRELALNVYGFFDDEMEPCPVALSSDS